MECVNYLTGLVSAQSSRVSHLVKFEQTVKRICRHHTEDLEDPAVMEAMAMGHHMVDPIMDTDHRITMGHRIIMDTDRDQDPAVASARLPRVFN